MTIATDPHELSTRTAVISADCHLLEPRDIYETTLRARLGDRTPRVERRVTSDGTPYDAWMYGNLEMGSPAALAAPAARFEDPENFKTVGLWEDIDRAAYDPEEFVHGLDLDGVWGGLVQPGQGLAWYRIPDAHDLSLIFAVANDFLAEFCATYPDRLRGVACLNVDEVDVAVGELQRSAQRGMAAAFIPAHPRWEQRYIDPAYDPLWAAAQDLDMTLLLHIATNRPGIPGNTTEVRDIGAADRSTVSHWVQRSLTDMIFGGVLDRFPRLRVGSSEHEAAWVPHWLNVMDYTYRERPFYRRGWLAAEGMLPSDYWRRNMFAVFMEDPLATKLRAEIGIDNLLWGNDYPHQESTWPRSQEFLDRFFRDVPEEQRTKIVFENAARLFKFNAA
jgi:predicted TIM-barrel fold metal-dependent hydrolase